MGGVCPQAHRTDVHRRAIGPWHLVSTLGSIARCEPACVIRTVGAAQYNVVTAAQCCESGVTEGQVKTLCRDRRWLRLNDGVYLLDADVVSGDPPRRR